MIPNPESCAHMHVCAGQADCSGLLEGLDHGEDEALRRHWEAALMDADSAVAMDPGYAKAYLRRAQALMRLQRVGEALSAAEEGQRLAAGSSGSGLGRELQSLVEELGRMCAGASPLGPAGNADRDGGKGSCSAHIDAAVKTKTNLEGIPSAGLHAKSASCVAGPGSGSGCGAPIRPAAENCLDLDEMD